MDAINNLISKYGFRFSNLTARREGVSEHVLFDAVVAGRGKIERTHWFGTNGHVSVYLWFA